MVKRSGAGMLCVALLLLAGCGASTGRGQAAPVARGTQPFAGLLVYDGQLAPDWFDASWNSVTKLGLKSPTMSGSRPLSLTVTKPWGGLFLRRRAGIDLAAYTSLRFAAQFSETSSVTPLYDVWLTDAAGRQLSQPLSLDNYGGQPSVNAWRVYQLPLADLDASGTEVGGIVIQGGTGGALPALYLTEIGFASAAPEATTPSPSPTSTPSPTPSPTPVNTPSAFITSTPAPGQTAGAARTPAGVSPAPTHSPSPSPGAPLTTPSVTTTVSGGLPIFVGGLAAGWGDASFGATVDLNAAVPAFNGSPAIAVRFTQMAGALVLRAATPIDLSRYSTLLFVAQSSGPGTRVEVRFAQADGRPIGSAVELDAYGGQPAPGSWTVYRIPLSAFAFDRPVSELIVQATRVGQRQPTLFLDDISLQ